MKNKKVKLNIIPDQTGPSGKVVLSLCGNDKGNIYFTMWEDECFFYLCDGKKHTLSAPKRKNKKHVKELGDCVFFRDLLTKSKMRDEKERNKTIHKFLIKLKSECTGGKYGKRGSH